MNSKISKYLHYLSLLIFVAFAVLLLYINREVLYTAHDRSEFLFGATFFKIIMLKPFGLIQYVGAWLTQLFYSPAIGACALGLIWTCIFYVGAKAFRLKGNASALMILPIACLLTAVVDLVYWIYVFTIRGYFFSQSVGYLMMVTLLWAARCTPRKWHLLWYLFAVCSYPVLGWFALLFIVCLALTEKPSWSELVGLLLLFTTTIIWRRLLYSNIKFEEISLAGFPIFEIPSSRSDFLSVPFWVLGALSILFVLFSRFLTKWYVSILCSLIGIAFTLSLSFYDKNYIDEMRMVRCAEKENWKEVLNIAIGNPKPTISMVMLKNVALMNEGGLLDISFKMGNDTYPISNPDSIPVSFLEIASPVVYYNYGLVNESFRLAFECAVQSGFSPCYLKMLLSCATANGETELVNRYEAHLKNQLFYSDWQPNPMNKNIKELHNSYPDELTGVENSDSYLVNSLSLWYDADSKLASEQALFYSMMRCDSRRFWASLRNYIKFHTNEVFPLHAMEAYLMYFDKAPEEKKMKLPVSQDVYDHYNKFWTTLETLIKSGMDRNKIPEQMRSEFGDTYWYYNVFRRKIYK